MRKPLLTLLGILISAAPLAAEHAKPTQQINNHPAVTHQDAAFEALKTKVFLSLLLDRPLEKELNEIPASLLQAASEQATASLQRLKGRVDTLELAPPFYGELPNDAKPIDWDGVSPIALRGSGPKGECAIVFDPSVGPKETVQYLFDLEGGEFGISHTGPTLGTYLLPEEMEVVLDEESDSASSAAKSDKAGSGAGWLPISASSNTATLYPSQPLLDLGSRSGLPEMSLLSGSSSSLPTPKPAERSGLRAEYYSNKTLSGTPSLIRTDASLNFDWGTASPGAPVTSSEFSASWRGDLLPQHSETYTFYANATDGVKVWINGRLIIESWSDKSLTETSGTVALTAGKKVSIMVLYYKASGDAKMQLSWSSASTAKQIVPASQLFPPGGGRPVVKSKPFSFGFGYSSNAWSLVSSPQNTPTTQGDFTLSASFAPSVYYSAHGPGFPNRILTNDTGAQQSGRSDSFTMTVSASWAGAIPGGSNHRMSIVIDSIRIHGMQYVAAPSPNISLAFAETTSGHPATSPGVILQQFGPPLNNMGLAGNYVQLAWNPEEHFEDGTSCSRTFTLVTSDGSVVPVDGVEITAHAIITCDPPSVVSAPFSLGYGFSGTAWHLQTSSLNTATTQGDFSFVPTFKTQNIHSAWGPLFTNRVLIDGPSGGEGRSARSDELEVTVTGSWNGSIPGSYNHRVSIVIDSISIYGVKFYNTTPTPDVTLGFSESTVDRLSSSPVLLLPKIGPSLASMGIASNYVQLVWSPGSYFEDGTTTTRSFKLVTSDGNSVPVDGLEIEGRVVMGYDTAPWNIDFEEGMKDWNVLPITASPTYTPVNASATTNANRVCSGELSLQLEAISYSPQITVISAFQRVLPGEPYQEVTYNYFYENLPGHDYIHREFGAKLRLYDSIGVAIPGSEFQQKGGFISCGNWFPQKIQFAVPSNASYYTIEFYWTARTGRVAYDQVVHKAMKGTPEPMSTGGWLSLQSDSGRDLWVASSLEKIYPDAWVPTTTASKIKLGAAKREAQSIQLVYQPKANESTLSVISGALTRVGGTETLSGTNVNFRHVRYVDITHSLWRFGRGGLTPDPIDPAVPTVLEANKPHPIWITVTVPEGTAAGVYQGNITLSTSLTTKTIPIEVEVFDFTLPEKPFMKILAANSTGVYRPNLRTRLKANRIFSEMSHGSGEGILALPVTINPDYSVTINWATWDPVATQYFAEGLSYFQIPNLMIGSISGLFNNGKWLNHPDLIFGSAAWETALSSYVSQVYAHLSANGWLDYAIWKVWDEPYTAEQATMANQVAALVRDNAPTAKIAATSWHQPGMNPTDVNVWIQSKQVYSPTLANPGDESWLYNNDLYLLDLPFGLTFMRNEAWWMWKERVEGLLWWSVTYGWSYGLFSDQDPYVGQNGGGFLFYPGQYSTSVLDSIRVAAFRDSVDDYDYFTLLAEEQDSAATLLGGTVTPPSGRQVVETLISAVEGKNNPLKMERARNLIGHLISFMSDASTVAFNPSGDYLDTNEISGFAPMGTIIENGTTTITVGANRTFTIDYTLPSTFYVVPGISRLEPTP